MARLTSTPHADAAALSDDVRVLFEDISTGLRHDQRAHAGECHPAVDVIETESSIEVVVDVSGIPSEGLRVFFRSGALVIAGEKAPAPTTSEHTFHLVEREFGRFARVVQVTTAIDARNARASLGRGELTVVLPKLAERRGRGHRIPITSAPGPV